MPGLILDERPELTRPILIAAFEGWNDAAEAASGAIDWLHRRWGARPFGHLDPEEYFDFQAVRPQVTLIDGVTRELKWPGNELSAARMRDATRDAVLLRGTEPSYQWRGFCDDVLEVVEMAGCEMVVTLGALLADVPHTRPPRITGTAGDEQLARRLGLEQSRYEGPTGIVGVLHDACRQRGLPSVSLWAPVPHYVANPPNPHATLALLEAVGRLVNASPDIADLRSAVEAWGQRIDEAVADDEDTHEYVQRLEERYDEELSEADLPTGEDLASQIEEFLREQPDED